MRPARRHPADVDHLPRLAELARLERASDGPIPELALRIWRTGSARAAERLHRQAMLRLAREEVREAIRTCRSWDEADPGSWRDDTPARMRRDSRRALALAWQDYRRELRRSRPPP